MNSIINDKKFLTFPVFFAAGYLFSRLYEGIYYSKVSKVAFSSVGFNAPDYYAEALATRDITLFRASKMYLNAYLGGEFLDSVALSALVGVFDSFVLQRMRGKNIFFQCAGIGMILSTQYLTRKISQVRVFKQFLLNVICTLAQQRIGVLGTIPIFAGSSVYDWQMRHNQKIQAIPEYIKQYFSSLISFRHFRSAIIVTTTIATCYIIEKVNKPYL